MAVKSILTNQTDFTGEFPYTDGLSGLWRFNESEPDADNMLLDSSSYGRKMLIVNWSGTTASLRSGQKGRYFRMNTNSPTTEKTHLQVTNDGSIFVDIGERIVVGGWMNPTTYSVGNTFCPIFNTRYGPGQPILYLSLYKGKPRLMLYNASGSLILDETLTMPFSLVNGGWYFFSVVIEPNNKKAWYVVGDRDSGEVWISDVLTFTGELNRECTADIVMGMHAGSYYYAGGFDDWFLDCNSDMSAEDLADYFRASLCANGGNLSENVDALTEPGAVTLRATDGIYPESGQITTIPALCSLSGRGRVSVTSEYTAGVNAVSLVETATSSDLEDWSTWQSIGASGELQSSNQKYIRYRITLTTTDTSKTPKVTDIQLHDIPKAPYDRLGFARPVILDKNGSWEAVLENAFDIIVTGEVNGADTLEFKLPFQDVKRLSLDNEKQVQIVNDVYRVCTLTDDKSSDGRVITTVYAEAAFYDLAYSEVKETVSFNADSADVPMAHALHGTEWSVGTVNVTTKRTWECNEKNALAVLRQTQTIHGGDLVFDCANHLVHLLSFSGSDNGVLFCYRKNMKSIQRVVDTRTLVTKLYAYGKDGMTFASINNGKEYVQDNSYTDEIRISTLDCSNFTNPYQMLEYTQNKLEEYAHARISYVLSAMDLSVLTGYEHESWSLGDIVTVDDKDLNLSVKTRVVRRQYNLQEPWNTVLELSSTLRELGDSSAQWDKAADVLASTDVIDRQEVKDLVPFNHLRNSRADSGMSYWVNSGFEADAENGVSGTASFKAEGESGVTKSMMQTVYPANRNSYTISAQIASENLEKGDAGQVGIEVVFEYEDGTTETRFIDLF